MLLRGDRVHREADNISPQEARGIASLVKRENEPDRSRTGEDPYVIPRNPTRAAQLLRQACDHGGHVTSCHNLAVMYTHGDDGVEPDEETAEHYKKLTKEKINVFGGF
jgi:TPR repeat protein